MTNLTAAPTTCIVIFSAIWCQPCKIVKSKLEAVNFAVPVLLCDIDSQAELATKLGVKSIPTVVFYRNGKEIQRWCGAGISREDITEMFKLTS